MFLKFHLKLLDLSLFLEGGGGLGKTTLSLFKDVTIGKRDNVTLYDEVFLMRPLVILDPRIAMFSPV